MTERERLIEILSRPIFPKIGVDPAEVVADYLLDNNITVPPVSVGQTVWVYNQSRNNIYENTVDAIKIRGRSPYKNKIYLLYKNAFGELSYRKFTWSQIGKQVFLTEQDAVEALAENLRKGAENT